MVVGNKLGSDTLRNLLIVNGWLEILTETVETDDDVDVGHRSRVGAIEEATEWLISCAQSCPSAVRLGPIAGLRTAITHLAADIRDPDIILSFDGEDMPLDFSEREAKDGTYSALLVALDQALDDVGQTLVGSARELPVVSHVSDEMVHIPFKDVRTWTLDAMHIINTADQALTVAPDSATFSNMAIVRDTWVCIISLASAIGVISDNEALDARSFLSQMVDASKSSRRALVSLSARSALQQWQAGDPFADAVKGALLAMEALSERATELIATALTQRNAKSGQMDWRILTHGRIDVSDEEAEEIIAASIVDLPEDRAAERAQELRSALGNLREAWQRAS